MGRQPNVSAEDPVERRRRQNRDAQRRYRDNIRRRLDAVDQAVSQQSSIRQQDCGDVSDAFLEHDWTSSDGSTDSVHHLVDCDINRENTRIQHSSDAENCVERDGCLRFLADFDEPLNIALEFDTASQLHEATLATLVDDCLITPGAKRPHMLHVAAARGLSRTIPLLIKSGVSLDNFDVNGHTALHLAAENGHLEVVKQLIDAGVYIDTENAHGLTPLFTAINCGQEECAAFLISQGANVHS